MSARPRIHLVSFATGIFLMRQWFLERSAIANQVVDTTTAWNRKDLINAGFNERAPEISLSSRGAGYWAWKPFVILHHLKQIPEGEYVLYCDVGRRNNFKLLHSPLDSLLEWMDSNGQDVMPGLLIPWKGPMSMWTKRDSFVLTGMDTPEIHSSTPIQASFSLWKSGPKSLELADAWMDWCARPELVNDTLGKAGSPELPDFKDHRHDQSLLTLCCLKHGIQALNLGSEMPPIDTQHPCEVSNYFDQTTNEKRPFWGTLVRTLAWPCEVVEKGIRKFIRVG